MSFPDRRPISPVRRRAANWLPSTATSGRKRCCTMLSRPNHRTRVHCPCWSKRTTSTEPSNFTTMAVTAIPAWWGSRVKRISSPPSRARFGELDNDAAKILMRAAAPLERPRSSHLDLGDAIVLGVSSSGPAQTLAVSLASLVAVCRYGGVVPLLGCFVAMLGIGIGYTTPNPECRGDLHLGCEGLSSLPRVPGRLDDPALLHLGNKQPDHPGGHLYAGVDC